MAGKLTIRRIGNLLPSMCLAGVLLVIGLIIWLCTAGLPGCALRYIEAEAAHTGLNLSIGTIKLAPRAGLAIKAENVTATLPQPDAPDATLNIRKALVGISLGRILAGDFRPANCHVLDAQIELPLSHEADDRIELQLNDIYTVFHRNNESISTRVEGKFCNIGWKLQLMLQNAEKAMAQMGAEETTAPAPEQNPLEQITEYRPALRQVRQLLTGQNWNTEQHPELELKIMHGKEWKANLKADIPVFEIEHFHFRDADLDATIENNTFTVNNLRFATVNPDTKVNLQGGYDWKERELALVARSTAPIVRMLNSYLGEDAPRMLDKIASDNSHTPSIELTGNASFAEDYALNNFSLRGKIEHHDLRLGRVPVDYAHLSFFMRDGQFNVDNFKLELPEGHISAAARAASGTGSAELDISLPDETILALAQELSGDKSITLPEELSLNSNLELNAKIKLLLPDFVPGKSYIEDLIPQLDTCDIRFNTADIIYDGTTLNNPSLTLHIDGIRYDASSLAADNMKLVAMVGSADAGEQNSSASDVLADLQLSGLSMKDQFEHLTLQKADIHLSATAAQLADSALNQLHATAGLSNLQLSTGDIIATLKSDAISAELHAQSLTHADAQADSIYLNADIPQGLNLADAWKNMQNKATVEMEIKTITDGKKFCATDNKLKLCHIDNDKATLDFRSSIGKEQARLQATASLADNNIVTLEEARLRLPAAELAPLFGGEPLSELKLPKLIEARGDAVINTETGHVLSSHYELSVPELIRVCNNVYVHKGREIPLSLYVSGNFSTAADGTMHYEADIDARHEQGELKVHASGNPLTECRITGSNTIPVSVINALIDNTDAHWIMRDFRCTPGVTRNNITNIDTTIRYDKGIDVYVTCKAELINMDFLLGAIRDKEDARGNPTGEEYLRTDLGEDPYSRVKHGTCDVEVIVQLDCVDAEGKPLPERIRINLLQPDLLYDNRPWLKRMGWKKGAATSRITGEAVRFNIDNSTISLHKLKGSCYPAYSIGMYYAPIQFFLEDVVLRNPAEIATDYCIFPLSRNCEVPMKGLIQAKAASGAGYRFLGTTIPFSNFSGFINISDVDVYLDRMNAKCWGGKMDGSLRIGFSGEHTTLDGFFVARNLNLKDIVASYGEEFTSATCNGYIRFQADKPDLDSVRAYGQVHLEDGDLMQMGLFRPIGAFLADVPGNLTKLQETVHLKEEEAPPSWADKLIRAIFDTGSSAIDTVQRSAYQIPFANHFLRYGIDEAFTRFDITKGHLITRDMKAKGYNLNVGVQLDIDLEKLTLRGDLWPKISSVPTVIISPITILSEFLIDINIFGDLLSPEWEFGLSKKIKGESDSVTSEPQKDEPLKTE